MQVAKDTRKRELAAIHIGKQQLGLSDDEYRDLLEAWTGKRSAGKLSGKQRHQVIEYFRKMGFKRQDVKLVIADDDKPVVKKIKTLWLELHRADKVQNPSLQGLNGFVKRVAKVDHVDWLTPAKSNAVIEGLKAWLKRA